MLIGILFAFKVLIFALCLGVVIAVLIYIPLFLYALPYSFWVGSQLTVGKHKDKEKEGFIRTIKNATTLYRCWITKKEPTC